MANVGAADVDSRLEEQLIDGILYAFQEQTNEVNSHQIPTLYEILSLHCRIRSCICHLWYRGDVSLTRMLQCIITKRQKIRFGAALILDKIQERVLDFVFKKLRKTLYFKSYWYELVDKLHFSDALWIKLSKSSDQQC